MPHYLAKQIEEHLQIIHDTYHSQLSEIKDIKDIRDQLSKVYNRAREHNNTAFIILIVGPVKSGKSTLVNLIANSYVSPTNFIECTVRPSIISRIKNGGEPYINTYRSLLNTPNGGNEQADQVEQIIDSLRGLIKKEDIENVESSKFPLEDENINKYVALSLLNANEDTTLLTTIHTPGGNLLQDNVFVIDMPGFDGAYANLDDPVYRRIADRVDLIIFVQSSNSAISKISTEFLQKLKQFNGDVPVCLFHNIFEAAYWREEKVKQKIIEEQKEFALNEIRKRGFAIKEEHAFSINLGMADDYRHGRYVKSNEDVLLRTSDQFSSIENQLYQLIISRREGIRIKNCINRTREQKSQLDLSIADYISKLENLLSKANEITSDFESLKRERIEISSDIQINTQDISRRITEKYNNYKIQYAPITVTKKGGQESKKKEHRFTTDKVRKIIDSFRNECNDIINSVIKSYCDKICCNLWSCKQVNDWYNHINEVCAKYHLPITTKKNNLTTIIESTRYDIPQSTESIVPHQPRYGQIGGGHKNSEILNYLDKVYKLFVGSQDTLNFQGYIDSDECNEVLSACLNKYTNNTIDTILAQYNQYIENKMLEAKSSIDVSRITSDLETLTNLRDDLLKIQIPKQ